MTNQQKEGEPQHKSVLCQTCGTEITSTQNVSAERFHGRLGAATLYKTAINVTIRDTERRELLSGVYDVADVVCRNCLKVVGWYYYQVSNKSNEWKIGKYCLEDSLANPKRVYKPKRMSVSDRVAATTTTTTKAAVATTPPKKPPLTSGMLTLMSPAAVVNAVVRGSSKMMSSSSFADEEDDDDDDDVDEDDDDDDASDASNVSESSDDGVSVCSEDVEEPEKEKEEEDSDEDDEDDDDAGSGLDEDVDEWEVVELIEMEA